MKLDLISYHDLNNAPSTDIILQVESALLQKGIIGIKDVPDFEKTSRAYIDAARAFASLPDDIKQGYAPDRDAGEIAGYELGVEKFQNKAGQWLTDDKKASFYAFVPEHINNQWPVEIDLQTPYL